MTYHSETVDSKQCQDPKRLLFISGLISTIPMGLVNKGATCSVAGCDERGVRSLNTAKVEGAGLRSESGGKKSVLCRAHYKEYKKETKKDRDLERARWS